MLHLLLLVALAAIAYNLFASYTKFAANLTEAKQSGIPYICTPIYVRLSPTRQTEVGSHDHR